MKIKESQYARTLYELTKSKDKKEINQRIASFFSILVKNGQVKLVSKIIKKFDEIWNEDEGIVEAEVTTLHKLDDLERQKIESYIQKKYDSKKVLIKNKFTPKIKGGIIIKVKDEILDGSIAKQLSNLKNNLSK